MKKSILFIIILISSTVSTIAQSKWEDNRSLYKLSADEEKYPLYILYRGVNYDYKFENDQFVCDITFHEIVRVTNDKALENRNQIYISMYNTIDLLDVKSRAISPEGKITVLDQSNIKEIEDEDTDGYKIFAVEGAEVGGEIEYWYVKRVQGNIFKNEVIQFSAPVKKLDFSLKSPENITFDFRTVNDTTKVVKTDDSEDYNYFEASFSDIPTYVNEGFSAGDPNKKRIDFKLAYNTNLGGRRLNTFSSAGKSVYDNITTLSKEEEKAVKAFIQKNSIKSKDPIEQFRNLEHAVKKQYYVEKFASANLEEFFKNGYGSNQAFVKIFEAVLSSLQIPHELVITGDRTEMKFYEGFDTWSYLTNYLFYLIKEDKYFAPHDMLYRYGSVPPQQTAMKGLFVKPELITDYTYPVTRIAYIPEAPYQDNMNNLDVNVTFDEDLTNTAINVKRTYTGTEGSLYKYALSRINEDQKKEMLEGLIEYLAIDADIDEVKVDKGETSYQKWDEPFVVSSTFKTESYLEQAGNSLLFKVGDLIGAQSELYQEEERIFEIENLNNRGYLRKISVTIPEGYQIQNPDDININEEVKKGEKVIYLFDSRYELKGNKLNIIINEFYDEIYYPAEKFDEFRKVINAAADFNKVTLILKAE